MYGVAATNRLPGESTDQPTLYGLTSDDRRNMRAYALGGVLATLRAQRGWSVEQAAVHGGIGHMTWRRMEDGLSVRARTYTVVDALFELPFGTARRALQDDLLMVQLIGKVGVDVSAVTVATAPDFIERFANQTMSNNARAAVAARSRGRGKTIDPAGVRISRSDNGVILTTHHVEHPPGGRPATLSDVEAVANVLDRLTKYRMDETMTAAVQSLLAVMPTLIERSLADISRPLEPGEWDRIRAEHGEHLTPAGVEAAAK